MRPSAFARLAVLGIPFVAPLLGACQSVDRSVSSASSAFSADEPPVGRLTTPAPVSAATSAPGKAASDPPPSPTPAPPAAGSMAGLSDGTGSSFGGAGGIGSMGHGRGTEGALMSPPRMKTRARPSALSSMASGEAFSPPAMPYGGAFNGPSIAAGEWDDNANYREFMQYLTTQARLPIHSVDVTDRRFLVVRDVAGKPVPRCRVTVTDQDQHATTLTTMASGRAILFPHAEGLTGRDLSVVASCPGSGTSPARTFALDDQDGAVDLRLTGNRELPENRPVDVAFILDTTGSMGEEIDAVRTTIGKVARELGRQNFHVRLGLVEYKDRGDAFVTKVHQFSGSSEHFLADVAKVTAGGGGDMPESVNEGLHVGLTGLDWGQDSVARFAFLIGDAPPHLDYANDSDYAVEMKRAAHEGIQLFTVAASGMDAIGQAVWRQVAEYTGATNLFVLRGGAGPQSTGAGDPKSSCGGTQTSYSSGNLDSLILGKITHELHGLDGDAMRIAGLYRDEDAKPCNERVAMMQ